MQNHCTAPRGKIDLKLGLDEEVQVSANKRSLKQIQDILTQNTNATIIRTFKQISSHKRVDFKIWQKGRIAIEGGENLIRSQEA